jgi:hypothetical protein
MGRKGLLIILLIVSASFVKAQQANNFRQIDSSMYAAYLNQDWNELIRLGKVALHNDIDYFYLRTRMGIAYFNKKNYRNAAKQMAMAINFNASDKTANEYLYYSLLYSGQSGEAGFTADSWSPESRSAMGIEKRKFFSGISFETGPGFSNNFDVNAMNKLPPHLTYRQQDLYGNSYYTELGISMNAGRRVSLYAGYSNLIISKRASIQYWWNEPDSIVEYPWGFEKFFPSDASQESQEYDYKVRQNSLYLNANILAGSGWSVTPAINYIHVNTENVNVQNLSQELTDTALYIAAYDTAMLLFNYDRPSFSMSPETLKLNNFVLSLAVNKQISVFDLGVFASYSNLNDQKQYQFGLSAIYYPFGNLNFYGSTVIKGLNENELTRVIFSQMLGVKTFRFLWLEGYGSFGNLRSTNEYNAFIVYNITDDINFKCGINLIFVILPSLQLSLRYQYMEKEGTRVNYSPEIQGGHNTIKLNYHTQNIIGGLKWNF